MRWGQITFIFALCLAVACVGCSTRTALAPESLEFDEIYVGDDRSIDLSVLTLDGKPLHNPEFSLIRGDDNRSFQLLQGGYLGTQSLLVFRPIHGGLSRQNILVKFDRMSFVVPVVGRAKNTPLCEETDRCHTVSFNVKEEKCVVETVPDETPCGDPECEAQLLCEEGICTRVPRENIPPVCQEDVHSVTLQPAWTYEADTNRELTFPGLVDAEDNLYLFDCRLSGVRQDRCDIVSLTADGQRRWRINESFLPSGYGQPGLTIVGGTLFVTSPFGGYPQLQVYRLSDGSLAWYRHDAPALASGGPGKVAAFLGNADAAVGNVLLFLDTETGAELKRLTGVVPGSTGGTAVGDGQGRVYVSSALPSGDPLTADLATAAVSVEDGLLWKVPGSQDVRATDGSHVFTVAKDVRATADGTFLYPDPGSEDLCLDPTRQAIYTMVVDQSLPYECQDLILRRLGLNDGIQQSSCRVREDDVRLLSLKPLLPTSDGGTVFLTRTRTSGGGSEHFSLRRSDADGNATYRARLKGLVGSDLSQPRGEPAIVNGRWVMSATVSSGQTAIIAYDVPGLALAAHGWMSPGGSQARNNAPW